MWLCCLGPYEKHKKEQKHIFILQQVKVYLYEKRRLDAPCPLLQILPFVTVWHSWTVMSNTATFGETTHRSAQ